MSQKRDPAGPPFFHQSGEAHSPSTLRSIEVAEEIAPDTEQMVGPVYVQPLPLVATSDHKTLEIQTIKLAEDIDPRKLPTELRLVRPPSVPPDSLWPLSEAGLAATQPPLERRRSRARMAVALLLAFLLLGTGLAWRARAESSVARNAQSAPAVVAAPAAPVVSAPPVATSVASAVTPAPAAVVADSAAPVIAEPAPSSVSTTPAASSEAAPVKRHAAQTAKNKAATGMPPQIELTSPNPSKPKRAIY